MAEKIVFWTQIHTIFPDGFRCLRCLFILLISGLQCSLLIRSLTFYYFILHHQLAFWVASAWKLSFMLFWTKSGQFDQPRTVKHGQIGEFNHLVVFIIWTTKIYMQIVYSALSSILEAKVVDLTSHGQWDTVGQASYSVCVGKQSKR